MNKFKEGDKVICASNHTNYSHYDSVVQKLEIGKEYTVKHSGTYRFGIGKSEEALDIVTGYGGYYPASLFVFQHEYKQSLIGDNIYEIF